MDVSTSSAILFWGTKASCPFYSGTCVSLKYKAFAAQNTFKSQALYGYTSNYKVMRKLQVVSHVSMWVTPTRSWRGLVFKMKDVF